MPWCDLKLDIRFGFGDSWAELWYRPKSTANLHLLRPFSMYELQRDLQKVATFAGFGDALERISCELRLTATNVEFGNAYQEVWGMMRLDAACLGCITL